MIWKLHNNGRLEPGAVVAADERLSWPKTIGLGAQHVVAMFGATFVFPLLMGLNPQLAVMMSGFATLLFLVLTANKVPSYLGSSASFVGVAASIYGLGGNPSHVTGALLVVGLALLAIGLVIHFMGAGVIHKVLPPAVTGAVVMLIGFNLATVVAQVYWPQDQWIALIVMLVVVGLSVALRGFLGRIAIFLSLIIGYVLSFIFDKVFGAVKVVEGKDVFRVNWSGVKSADWLGLPPVSDLANWTYQGTDNVLGFHTPTFNFAFILIALPVVIALVAENTGHVKAVAEMTGTNLDSSMGRAIAADGAASALASAIGAGPTTTYAENIGVMASTRVYSTAAYVVAALVAILFGFSPKFGAVISATPPGVLGGITVVLYGMIGLLGAKIWKENRVDFGNPINLVPLGAGLIIGIGNVSMNITDSFVLGGIAFGTIVVVGLYHLAKWLAPQHLSDAAGGTNLILDTPGMYVDEDDDYDTAPRPRS